MKVLIVGCGDLGTETGLRFAAGGHTVVGLRRRAELLPPAIEPLAGDLTRELPPLPSDVDAVVFTPTAGERSVEAYRRVYVDGMHRLFDGLRAAGARPAHLLHVSSTAVYGVTDGSWVDEDTPTAPGTRTGAVLVEAEGLLASAPCPSISLRLAGVYGPGRTYLIDQVRSGDARLPPRSVHTNRIHRDDAADAIVHLLTRVADPASCYVGVDHAPAERAEVLRFLADGLGVPHPPVDPAVPASGRGGDKRCRNDRLVATGFAFRFPSYREGYRAILRGEGVRHP